MQHVRFEDLGRISYADAWAHQSRIHQNLIARKLAVRKGRQLSPAEQSATHTLLFCEHPPVYTLGKSGSLNHLLLDESELQKQGFEFFKINRGGDITYHGPGQIVGYPILDLDEFFTDVHRYVRYLEEAVIRTLAEYGIRAGREPGYTGVWLPGAPKRKICAIGVHLSRWVTLHGFAFNVNTQLAHFQHIVPCGIQENDKEVTSMAHELGKAVPMEEVKTVLKGHFAELFDINYLEDTHEEGYSAIQG